MMVLASVMYIVMHGRSLKANLCKLCLIRSESLPYIWRQRNDLLHGNTPRSKEALVAQIDQVGGAVETLGEGFNKENC
jgi:hypothetical protein